MDLAEHLKALVLGVTVAYDRYRELNSWNGDQLYASESLAQPPSSTEPLDIEGLPQVTVEPLEAAIPRIE